MLFRVPLRRWGSRGWCLWWSWGNWIANMTLVAPTRHHFHRLSGFLRGEEEGGETKGPSLLLLFWLTLTGGNFLLWLDMREGKWRWTALAWVWAKKASALLYSPERGTWGRMCSPQSTPPLNVFFSRFPFGSSWEWEDDLGYIFNYNRDDC